MGRPKKDVTRYCRKEFKLNEAESARLREFSALNNMSESEYIRKALELLDAQTRSRFNLSGGSDDVADEYFDDFYDELDDDWE